MRVCVCAPANNQSKCKYLSDTLIPSFESAYLFAIALINVFRFHFALANMEIGKSI